jgi:hypothetical protein
LFGSQEFGRFRLPHDSTVVVFSDGLEKGIDDCVASAFRKDEVLIRIEFKEDILLVFGC